LEHKYKVLNHGFLNLVDHMGSDDAIVTAARVSYGQQNKSKEEDRKLIRYLMKHRHTSPFEMCEVKLHVKLPIFVARQWVRHRTASLNEISGRYSVLNADQYIPKTFRKQSQSNKQGSSEESVEYTIGSYDKSVTEYQKMLNLDISKEISRIVLPLATYTEWYWKIDLHNLFHFLKLRLAPNAQQEIREYAQKIAIIVKDLFPISWEAFEDYMLNSVNFSANELECLSKILNNECSCKKKDKQDPLEGAKLTAREKKEFQHKIKIIKRIGKP